MTDKQTAENGRFTPGGKGGPGRPKGVPNKTTREVREAVGYVFDALQQDEGAPYTLVEWAKANPSQFYQLASKLIPSATNHTHSGTVSVDSFTENEARRMAEALLASIAAGETKATEGGEG